MIISLLPAFTSAEWVVLLLAIIGIVGQIGVTIFSRLGTKKQLSEIHILVNSRLETALNKIKALEKTVLNKEE
jgi:hypothetical protein